MGDAPIFIAIHPYFQDFFLALVLKKTTGNPAKRKPGHHRHKKWASRKGRLISRKTYSRHHAFYFE